MKIEKISENQIRCTLTKEDLDLHHIRLSELAYGTDKAKKLFRDMMQKAHTEFGFEADNIPLMIEAIPLNAESIILIITKVEDPEELDTRFSKFAPYQNNSSEETLKLDGADDIIDIFHKLYESKVKGSSKKPSAKPVEKPTVDLVRLYQFPTFDSVIEASHGLNGFYTGENSLYKDLHRQTYSLVVHQSSYTPEEFNKVCNILSEYGQGRTFTHAGEAHLMEHGEIIVAQKALQQLYNI